eukprot:1922010-Rhodomonas_salina.1
MRGCLLGEGSRAPSCDGLGCALHRTPDTVRSLPEQRTRRAPTAPDPPSPGQAQASLSPDGHRHGDGAAALSLRVL